MAQTIQAHPDARWIMVSDAGQPDNPPPEALKKFRQLLSEQGIGQGQLNKMMIEAPKDLLFQ